ncbi:MAG: hypothetical protein CM15mV49_470 [uncultured marine virus]|nr:MAG: hypothetical protein CM15mV49_470 [uncultured marine virus]
MNEQDYRSVFPTQNYERLSSGRSLGDKSRWRIFCGRCRWLKTRAWCRFTHYRRPHSEQDALSKTSMESWEWYTQARRSQRRRERFVVVMTKMVRRRLNREINKSSDERSDGGQVGDRDFPKRITDNGQPQWPEYWKKTNLKPSKRFFPMAKWNAKWQQHPTSDETSLIKRNGGKKGKGSSLPKLQYIIQATILRFLAKFPDFSAITLGRVL